jgi:hypothetical protein
MQNGPRFLTQADINQLTLLNPSNVPANQPTALHDEYGSLGQTEDGRLYRFVKFAGTSTIQPGLLLTAPATPANALGLVIPASTAQPNNTAIGNGTTGGNALAAGSTSFVVTNGTTTVTQDEFQFVEILVAAGGTYNLKLRGNTAATSGQPITLYLATDEPLPPNITTLIPGSDTVNLRYSNWNQPTATLTAGSPVGVTVVSVPQSSTASYGGWVQVKGRSYVQSTSGTAGYPAAQDRSGTAGFLINSTGATEPQLGIFVYSEASSAATVNLDIPV